jgi:DNA-binding NarL/FixJ family response regulator
LILVGIAAESTVLRAGLSSLLAADGRVSLVDLGPGWGRLLDTIAREQPDVLVACVRGPDDETACAEILDHAAERGGITPILLMTDRADRSWIREHFGAGLRGVLPLDADRAEILAAIEAAAAGLVTLPVDEVAALLPRRETSDGRPFAGTDRALSPRELEVLQMMAEGIANKTIAARLSISEHTVKFHVASILEKLGAESRTEAVTRGLRRGLILL